MPFQRRPKTTIILQNKGLCALHESKNERNVIIVVLSARAHFNKRNLVRQTYGTIKKANNVKVLAVVFMIGNQDAPGVEKVDFNKLDAESDQFGDIVIGDFVDTYRNLTLKTIMAYEWLHSHCREAQIVVKTDDDVVVNIFQLTKLLDALSPSDVVSSNIWCAVHRNENTIQDVNSRFYASPEEFPDGKFPDHCGGVGYVTPLGVVDRIIDKISKSFLGYVCTHEDVFMTLIVPQEINSIHNSLWRQSKPIELVNKNSEWISMALESGRGDEDHYLVNLLQQKLNETKNYDKFRSRYETKVFYLLAHTNDFEEKYLRLWQVIEFCFAPRA